MYANLFTVLSSSYLWIIDQTCDMLLITYSQKRCLLKRTYVLSLRHLIMFCFVPS